MYFRELELVGFNGSSDDTDKLILWVSVDDKAVLSDILVEYDLLGHIRSVNDSIECYGPKALNAALDYRLPAMNGKFARKVKSLTKANYS